MSLLSYISKPIKNFISDDLHYEKQYKYKDTDIPEFVPEQYRKDVLTAANEFDFDPKRASALLNTENTPWDPTLKNPLPGSSAQGLGQHTDAYYQQYNPKFKEKYQRDYNKTKPFDSIAATFIGLKDLKDRLGNEDDAIKAYHVGLKGLTDPDEKYNSLREQAGEYFKKVMSNLIPKNMVK